MTRAYDPRSSRPRPAVAPDPEAAPIEALLGPEPEPSTQAQAAQPPGGPPPGAGPALAPRPTPGPRAGAPSAIWQLAPLLAIGVLIGTLVWWLTRRRGAR